MPVKTGIKDWLRDDEQTETWIPAPDRVRGRLCAGMTGMGNISTSN
jgi:hypothetical protein